MQRLSKDTFSICTRYSVFGFRRWVRMLALYAVLMQPSTMRLSFVTLAAEGSELKN